MYITLSQIKKTFSFSLFSYKRLLNNYQLLLKYLKNLHGSHEKLDCITDFCDDDKWVCLHKL